MLTKTGYGRAFGVFFVIALSVCLAAISEQSFLPKDLLARDLLTKDPIAFIGHGAMFDRNGKEIEPTPMFIAEAQAFYMDYLSGQLTDQQRELFSSKRGKLFADAAFDEQSKLAANSSLIDWLIQNVEAKRVKNADILAGKNNLLKWILRSDLKQADRRAKKREAFKIPDVLQNRLDEAGLSKMVSRFSTTSSGADYINECRNSGVPIPPDWGSSQWVSNGVLSNEFISASFEAEVFVYQSTSPPGVSIALPRSVGNSIGLLGIISLGRDSSKVCFWDNQQNDQGFDIPKGTVVPLSQFAGGAELFGGSGGTCTACHAGENPFVIHPGTALDFPNRFGKDWYDPLVHPNWPQNAGPLVGTPGSCNTCHKKGGTGGRFPKISSILTAPDGSSYCSAVLNNAIARTMPTSDPGNTAGDSGVTAHANALRALCNTSPTPQMRIEETVLNYGDVELGFTFTKALVIHNDGDADLTFSVTTLGAVNSAIWPEITPLMNTTLTPGDPPMVLPQRYAPQTTGTSPDTIQLRVTSNDPSITQQDIMLTGRGIGPIPLDTVLVLDRSGSMSDRVGERFKIDALQVAANLYSDLLRENINNSGTGDKLGFVKYNESNSIYMTLDFINATKRTEVQNKLSNSAIGDPAQLKPMGLTGIGGAMQTGASMLLGTPADRKQAMVVLTDGKENQTPSIMDVKDPIQNANRNLKMYSVGLGTDIEPAKLQAITNVGNGYHQVSDSLSGVSLFDLETFYFKIFASAVGMDLVVDPTHVVNLLSPNVIVIDTARIVTSDRTATFLVLDDPVLRSFYDLQFVSPKGQIIMPGVNIGGIPIQESRRHTYKLYRIIFPDLSKANSYVGDWVLRLKPNGRWSQEAVKNALRESKMNYSTFINPHQGLVPIGFAAAVASNYKLDVSVSTVSYLPGTEVRLTASLTDRGWPALDGKVNVTVTSPGGSTHQVTLHDDGTHGDQKPGDGAWTNLFVQTAQPNVYKFLFRSTGRNDRGELAPREATRYVTLKQPEPPPGDGDNKPCRCLKECLPCIKKCLDAGDCRPRTPGEVEP